MCDSPSTVVALSSVQSWLLLFGELTVNILYDVTSRSPSHLNPGLFKIIRSSSGNRDVTDPIAEVLLFAVERALKSAHPEESSCCCEFQSVFHPMFDKYTSSFVTVL